MYGAIIGDVVGSRFEFRNYLGKDFQFFDDGCYFTDDTVMTVAVMRVLNLCNGDIEKLTPEFVSKEFRKLGRNYPSCGYGGRFYQWMLYRNDVGGYDSCGNGAAMRISPVGWYATSEDEVIELSDRLTVVTHNHEESMKGARVTAMCVYKAVNGCSKEDIIDYASKYYDLDMTCDSIREETKGEHGKEICQVTVPQALVCFRDGVNFEDVIRNCVSVGGDSDTIGAIAGGIAGAYYREPWAYDVGVQSYLDDRLNNEIISFYDACVERWR